MRAIDDDAIERGFTLVEMLITVWILGAVIVTVCGAIFTMIRGSDYTNRSAIAQTELRRWADALRAADYQDCATVAGFNTTDNYAATKTALDSQMTVTFWNKANPSNWLTAAAIGSDGTHCKNATGQTLATGDTNAQQITLTVTMTGSPPITATTTLTKRDNGPLDG